MSADIIREWNFWLASIAAGACMAFAYDMLRLFRRLVRHGRIAVDLEDILYWMACFFLSFALLYYGNNGVIRFAAVLGAAVGMALYAVTVGRFFVRVSYMVIDKTIGSLFRLAARIMRKAAALSRPVKRKVAAAWRRWIKLGLFQKYRLTQEQFHHRMKIEHARKTSAGRRRSGHGGQGTKQKKDKAQKDAKVPTEQE